MKTEVKTFLCALFASVSLMCLSSEKEGWKVLFDFSDSPYIFNPPSWRIGLPEWPAANFLVPENSRDWRKYDRLIVELFNDDEGGDRLMSYIGSANYRLV